MDEVLGDMIFYLKLFIIIAVLKITSAALAVIRTRWLSSLRMGIKDLGDFSQKEGFLFSGNCKRDSFSRQTTLKQDNAAVLQAAQPKATIDYFFDPDRVGIHHLFRLYLKRQAAIIHDTLRV